MYLRFEERTSTTLCFAVSNNCEMTNTLAMTMHTQLAIYQ